MTTAADTATGTIPVDSFANRLVLARVHAGHLSIREAAELCGIGRGAWTNWEKGSQPEAYDLLVELVADKLGIDRDWLRDGGALAEAPPIRRRHARWHRGASVNRRNPPRPARPSDSRPTARATAPSGPGRTRRVTP